MRGSAICGATTMSSRLAPYAAASRISRSRVGRRIPDSRRERVLTEMPVSSASWTSVRPRLLRSSRRRLETPSSARRSRHSSRLLLPFPQRVLLLADATPQAWFVASTDTGILQGASHRLPPLGHRARYCRRIVTDVRPVDDAVTLASPRRSPRRPAHRQVRPSTPTASIT